MDVALALMGGTNVRELQEERHILTLKKHLKGLRVRQVKAGKLGKIRTVRDIVPQAGKRTFEDHEGRNITVQVRQTTLKHYSDSRGF